MLPLRIKGATREMAKDQEEYTTLPVLDRPYTFEDGFTCNEMVTLWEPTPAELEALNKGAPIQLSILGIAWPPVFLGVGEIPE